MAQEFHRAGSKRKTVHSTGLHSKQVFRGKSVQYEAPKPVKPLQRVSNNGIAPTKAPNVSTYAKKIMSASQLRCRVSLPAKRKPPTLNTLLRDEKAVKKDVLGEALKGSTNTKPPNGARHGAVEIPQQSSIFGKLSPRAMKNVATKASAVSLEQSKQTDMLQRVRNSNENGSEHFCSKSESPSCSAKANRSRQFKAV